MSRAQRDGWFDPPLSRVVSGKAGRKSKCILGLIFSLAAAPAIASAPAGDWWNTDYAWRRKITLADSGTATPAGTVVSVSFDHATLVSGGKSQADGDDVRVAYWDGTNWTELSRALSSASSWNNASTQILFKTVAALGVSANSDDYYLYFGNASATAPTVSVATGRWYKTEQLVEQSTTSTTFTDVPSTTLTFTPGDASETWVIFVSGTIRSSSTGQNAAEMQLLVNGAAVDYWGHQVSSTTAPNRAGFLIPYLVTGTAAIQTIQPQFKASAATTAYAGTIRVVAALVPPGADAQFTENNNIQQLTGSGLTLQTLTFTPSSAGDYMIIGKVSHHETPSTSTAQSWVEDDVGTAHPDSPAGTRYSNARAPWAPVTTVFRRTLPLSSRTFTLKGTSSTSGTAASQWRSTRLMAFRADAWEAAEYNEALAQSTTTSASFQTMVSLTTAAPPALRDYLVIQAERVSGNTTTSTYAKAGELRDGGVAIMRTDHKISYNGSATTGYHHTVGVANVKRTSAQVTYDNGFLSPTSTLATIQCADSTICSLRYRDTSNSQGSDESVPKVTFTTSSQSAGENGGTMTVTAQLSAVSAHDVSVPFTVTGTASSGSDYTITASPITITAGSTTASITITVSEDAVDEPDETVIVTMGTPTGAVQGATTVHTATIVDNDVAGVNIAESGGSTNVTEVGATDTYTVVLNSQPTADVVVTVAPDSQSSIGSGAGVSRQLTFTSANWNTTQTITVTATDDPDIDGSHTSTISHTASSTDSYYSGIGIASVTAHITDDDTAGVIITESGGSTNVTEGGATDTYTVVLHSRPTANVIVTVTPDSKSDVGAGAGVARQLTFTYGNWSTAQTVTVTAVNDAVAEGVHNSTITHSASSTDLNYHGIAIAGVTASITDNDIAYVNFSLAAQSALETDGSMTVDVTLSMVAANNVSVPFTIGGTASTPANYAMTASPVTITAGQLSTTITITIIDDFINNPDRTVILTMGNPTNGTKGTVTVHTATIVDDEPPGVTVVEAGGSTAVTEGGTTDSYTLKLQSQPLADVVINVTTDGKTTVNPASVTFTAGNWNAAQTITVTATNDAIAEGAHSSTITNTASSADADYNAIAIAGITATITDNDTAGVTVTQSDGSTAVVEGGATDTYTVVLTSEPTANVTVTIGTSGGTTVSPASLTFTAGDWSTPQTVTVTAVDDAVAEGTHSSSVTHSVTSADTMYNGITVAGISVSITDNDTAGVVIAESGGATDVAEGGATDTYTVVLHSQPTAGVTVTISTDGKTTVSPSSLSFTTGNWNTPQTVTVTAVDDAVAEGVHSSTITHTGSSSDTNYAGIGISSLSASITDNDTAGVTITESGGTTNVTEGGATDTYTVMLHSQPTASVTVTISTDGKTTVSPTSLTFTTGNWSTARTVTVTAVDDTVAEGSHSSSITHSAASTDSNYSGISVDGVTAGITDNDTAYVNFSLAAGSALESAGTMTVTVTLSTTSTSDVTVPFTLSGTASSPADYTVTASPVTILAGQLSTTITITMVDDLIHEPNETVILTMGNPTNGTKGTVTVHTATITDNEALGVTTTESGGSTSVTEGGATDSYTVVLRSQPVADVTLGIGTDGKTTVNPTSVTFTSGNWNTPRTITVTAVDDQIAEGAHSSAISYTLTSADTDYNGLAVSDVTVTITDNDTAGVTIAQSGGSTAVSEAGATDSYTVVLKTQPTADVTITVGTDGKTTVSPASLTFTSGNWSTLQTVTVTAVDDAVAEGTHNSTVTHTAASADSFYNGLTISNVTASVTDNDTAGATITESGGSTDVAEGGTTDTYNVALTSQPTANVTITISTDGKTTANPASLTFTSGNWNSAQTVTVTATDDAVVEGAHNSAMTLTAASTDSMYSGLAAGSVTAHITDNDTAGVTIAESGGTTSVTEGGATDGYDVALQSQPIANVTITIVTDGKSTVSPASLTFTSGNWNTPQTVTVTAVDNAVADGSHTSSIAHSSTSTDANYSGITVAGVTAAVADNDAVGVTVTESGGSTDVAEGGATDSYTLVLTSQPLADVAVTVTPDAQSSIGSGAGVARVLTFTAANWSTPQTVTVVAFDDAVAEGAHSAAIAHTSASVDSSYNGIGISGVTVHVTDNDTAGVVVAESSGSTDVTEGGTTDTYTLVLHSKPVANVVVTATPGAQTDLGAGGGAAVTVTFTPSNWNTPQTIVVAAVDDAIVQGARTSAIVHTVTSADPNYSGIGVTGVTAHIADNDVAYANFSLAAQSTMETAGSATVDVNLSNVSTVDVTVPFTLSGTAANPGNYTITASPVTILAGQSSTTITVTIVDDFINNPDRTVILTMGNPTNGTKGTVAVHTATIVDDEPPGVAVAESGGSTAVTEGGSTDAYTMALQSQPLADVTVTVATDGKTTASPASLTFNAGNWNVPQTITVTAVNDAVAEGVHSSVVTHTATSTDADYNGIAISDVTATIVDNDTAGVTITQSSGSTATVEGGATDSYSLALTSEPTANVTITIGTDGNTTVSPTSVTFTAADWSTSQTITVTAVDDSVAQGPRVSTIGHSATSADAAYNGIVIGSVTASIADNDVAGVVVYETGGATSVTEGGATDTYTVVLSSQPTAVVAVALNTDGKCLVGPGLLTFSAANWSTPQTVTVTAVDDWIAEGSHASAITHAATSVDSVYNGITVAGVTAGITDNETAGVTVTQSGGSTDVSESGATDTYTLVLTSQPLANVTVTVTPDSQSSIGSGFGVARVLTFTAANWSTPQTVTVIALDDLVAEGAHNSTITHVAASADPSYNGIGVTSVVAHITDNDTAGVVITESGGSTDLAESGTTDTYTVVLHSKPTADVVITATPDAQTDPGAGGGTAIALTFTPGNWDTPQTITLRAVDDDVAEGSHTGAIAHSAASTDGVYNGIGVAGITAHITDNDTAGITLAESGGSTNVAEGGATDSYSLVLRSQPTTNVTIAVSAGSAVTVSPTSLTFTSANWNTPQAVTVTAVDDVVAQGVHAASIAHSATSSDANYNALTVAGLTASIADNDVAGVRITQSGGTTAVSEAGLADTYTIELTSQPTAGVTVTVTPDAQVSVSPTSLTFTSANWNQPQTVTIAAVNDQVAEGGHNGTVAHAVVSADPKYDNVSVAGLTASITDNDVAVANFTQAAQSTMEDAGSVTVTVTLSTVSTQDVSVPFTLSGTASAPDDYTITSSPVTILAGTLSATITVSVVADTTHENDETAILTMGSPTNAVAGSTSQHTVTIRNDDLPGIAINESDGSTRVIEGGATDTYAVVLLSKPKADVAIAVATDGQTTATPSLLTFTPANWNVPQTVAVAAVDDLLRESSVLSAIEHTVSSGDLDYHGLSIGSVLAQVQDNDSPGAVIAESNGATMVARGLTDDSYTVVLTSVPTADVNVMIVTDGWTTVSPRSLVFRPDNWSEPQTVTVRAPRLAVVKSATTSIISHSLTSTDPGYVGIEVAPVVVKITDYNIPPNNQPRVMISQIADGTEVTEGGPPTTYTVVLNSRPSAVVVVTPVHDSRMTVSPGSLTFTPQNWADPQTVTVTAVDDQVVKGDYGDTITHTTTSADPSWNALAVDSVVIGITEDDVVGVAVSETNGNTRVTEGQSPGDSYRVVLTGQPTSDVQVAAQPDPGLDLGAGPGVSVVLTFTPDNWNVEQTVAVAVVNDEVAEGPRTAFIRHLTASNDIQYDGLVVRSVSVQITDDDSVWGGTGDTGGEGETGGPGETGGAGPVEGVEIVTSPNAAGQVKANLLGDCDGGQLYRLTPIPADGYEFASWSGDVNGHETPLIVCMKGPMRIVAQFDKLDSQGPGGVGGGVQPQTVFLPCGAAGNAFLVLTACGLLMLRSTGNCRRTCRRRSGMG